MGKVRALERLVVDAKKKSRAFKRDIEQHVGPVDWNAQVDIGAVRSSLRKAAIEAEIEHRVAGAADRWLRQDELERITGLRRTTLWKLRREDSTFPHAQTPTAGRAVRFRESDVRRWMADRARKTNGQA